MPIHDWTRVRANRFHHFHQYWTTAICTALNAGLLPADFFAMVEQRAGGPEPDVVALALTPPDDADAGGVATKSEPPKTQFVYRCENTWYARKADRITVRHRDGYLVAVVEIVSPGNKASIHAIRSLVRKSAQFLRRGLHLLIVDLFPPTRRDPQGIHKLIWDEIEEEPFELPPDKPLTLAAYVGGEEMVAYVEPVAVGDLLPDMPIFLTPEAHVPCPLESTYQTAWDQFPAPLKEPLEQA